jgi:hypothetical protein
MSVGGEISGVGLSYVAREIKGSIPYKKTKFDAKLGENVYTDGELEKPVIVFFSNGTTQVFSMKRAEAMGFLVQPDVMNIASVQDAKTPAGRYKNAIKESVRLDAWQMMEEAVIQRCVAKTGHPLPLDCSYKSNSIYFDADEKELAA